MAENTPVNGNGTHDDDDGFVDDVGHKKPTGTGTDAHSAYGASTLMTEGEKQRPSGQVASGKKRPGNLLGSAIETSLAGTKGLDPVYAAKAQLLNEALLDIGMGRYQWFLVVVTAVGWFLDEFWLASFTVILPSASNEAMFYYTYNNATDLMISAAAGLTLGAVLWPVLSDLVGRKQPFTSTLVLAGMAGLVGAGMTAFTGLCVVGFILGFAVGGNQIDDAMYLLESLPPSHQWLVAAQGVVWGLGQLVAYAVGWAFIELWTCGTGPDAESTASSTFSRRAGHSSSSSSSSSSSGSSASSSSSSTSCHYVSNKGWRYTWWCFGCITLFLYLLRFTIRTYETPKSLLARRRDAEAVQTTRDIAHANKQITWLNEAAFARVDTSVITEEEEGEGEYDEAAAIENGGGVGSRRRAHLRSASRKFGIASSVRAVVATLGPLGLATLCLLWASLGLTFTLQQEFLPPYLAAHAGVAAVNADTVSRPYLFSREVYVAICAIPGPLVAAFLVEMPLLGRKRAGALLYLLAGVLMLASTAAPSRGAVLAFSCVLSFLQFALLAVLTLYTVEVFGAPVRGVGVAVTGFSWRLFGMLAWIVAGYSTSTNGGAVWFSGALSIVVTAFWVVLPRETRAVAAA